MQYSHAEYTRKALKGGGEADFKKYKTGKGKNFKIT